MDQRGSGDHARHEGLPVPRGGNGATSPSGSVEPPVPSLPKGGGAIRSIAEKLSANPVTGAARVRVPLAVSPGRSGFHPDLSLAYDTGAGNGPFGHGFRLSLPQITRRTDKGLPSYDDASDADVFILSEAEDLVPRRLADAGWQRERFEDGKELVERYAPRVEGHFARIERRTDRATRVVHWRATTPDNVTSIFGRSEGARVAHPSHPELVFSWLLEETRDDRGNVIRYQYKAEDLAGVARSAPFEANRWAGDAPIVNRYPKRIRYGNTVPFDDTPGLDSAVFEVVFDYGEHDAEAPGVGEVLPWPCRQDPFSSYRAGFEVRTYRLCRRVLMFHRMAELGDTPCLVRSTDLTYADDPALTRLVAATQTGYLRDPATGAYTTGSYPPIEFGYSLPAFQAEIRSLDPASVADLPEAVGGAHQWLDLDGEGLPGVLGRQGDALFYKQNLGGELAPARLLLRQPSLGRSGGGGLLATDLDGDGRKELALLTPPEAGYFDRTEAGDFEPLRLFPAQLQIDRSDPSLCHVDLNGDGHEDVLIAGAETFTWYPSLAKDGFGPPITFRRPRDDERAPALVFAGGAETVFLADMSGDGLTDLVRVENGSVCYWPNLGHGRFGARVQMGGEAWFDHPDCFDPRRIRLADIDGSGTTDVLYLHRDGVRIHANRAGNTLAAPITLPAFPDTSDLSSIAVVDLLGAGTGCLVWSSSLPGQPFRGVRYIDLLGSRKPHLLTFHRNDLGQETHLEYAPSTRFYLEDALAGRPWVTRLPFPVHVLVRVQTYDPVSRRRFVSRYAYHHGCFDGVEREFRGFGMVEQWDTESFSAWSGKGDRPPPANAADPEMHLAPVRRRTWFHTGARGDGGTVSRQYAHEYYAGDPRAAPLPDTVLPEGLTADEAREACRALAGAILREETYADDGSAAAEHPYAVSEQSWEVRCLQPRSGEAHGVFFVHPREAIEHHYDRDPSDPRISHAFTLEVDDHGVVRRSAAVGYPRRAAHAVFEEQRRVAITLAEADVFHRAATMASGWYRLGVPLEARSYEITGLAPRPDALLSFEAVSAAASAAVEIPNEATPDGSLQKRLLSQARTLYLREDLSGPLPLGEVASRALPHRSYIKAFTPALLAEALGGRATDAILLEGGYVKLAGDDAWWAPSGSRSFAPDQFYLPVAFFDAFGNRTSIVYDEPYRLLVTRVTGPLGNIVSVAHDHRVLAPALVTDPNGNRTAARFDALGMVVATAVMGKEGAGEGDTLDDPTATFDYDLGQRPAVAHTRARERHGASDTRWQESFSYTDGSGREVMRKVRVEPGPLEPGGAVVSPRWVGTGRTVLDNKGHPVKQYEPYFSATSEYEDEPEIVERGVTPILRYDPLGRLVRTDLPNGTFSKVELDPWRQAIWDPNDTVLESAWYQARRAAGTPEEERRAADLAAAHAGTPTLVHLDALGRAFLTLQDNGPEGRYATSVALDIEGRPLAVTDARGVVAMRRRFGMTGDELWHRSSDAGERWAIRDVGGAPLRAWDARGFTRRAVYDEARRPTHLYVQPEGGAEFLAERMIYGEALGDAAVTSNHRGRIYQRYDGAGLTTSVRYDFEGNLLAGERRLAREYRAQIDWSPIEAGGAEGLLEAEVFGSVTAYDALGRPTSVVTPDRSEIKPTFDEGGLLDKVEVRIRGAAEWTTFVAGIDHDAKGQRERLLHGNGVLSEYSYDPLTFRLSHLASTRTADGERLQRLRYTHDPVGNIVEIRDGAQQRVFFDDDVVTPSTAYVYDAIYRLTQATGRERAGGLADVQRGQDDLPLATLPHPNDAAAARRYTESYGYDAVGNLLRMVHDGGAPATSWTRRYDVDDASNRLLGTSVGGDEEGEFSARYAHDAHGNMIAMPHLRQMGWDHRDLLVRADKDGGGMVYFTHDASGQRVRKVWEHSGLVEERIYLGGFEIHRRRTASGLVVERETLHVMDGVTRIAMIETTTVDAGAPAFAVAPRIRYQMGNHLGSAVLEVDEAGLVIGYEEYHPYGTSAWRSARSGVEVSERRYRYTGKERDEETGLYSMGVRCYAPWLGRWTSADPAGIEADGPGLYSYCRGNPTGLSDGTGKSAEGGRSYASSSIQPKKIRTTLRDPPGAGAASSGPPDVPSDPVTPDCYPNLRGYIPTEPTFVTEPESRASVGGFFHNLEEGLHGLKEDAGRALGAVRDYAKGYWSAAIDAQKEMLAYESRQWSRLMEGIKDPDQLGAVVGELALEAGRNVMMTAPRLGESVRAVPGQIWGAAHAETAYDAGRQMHAPVSTMMSILPFFLSGGVAAGGRRGGMKSVKSGTLGERVAKRFLQERWWNIVGEKIYVRLPGGRKFTLDFLAEKWMWDGERMWLGAESKHGAGKLSLPQQVASDGSFGWIEGTPFGKAAEAAGVAGRPMRFGYIVIESAGGELKSVWYPGADGMKMMVY